jgi:DNA-binding MarR family transcriptional regulator
MFENCTLAQIQERAEKGIIKIAKKYHLQPLYLRQIFYKRNMGLNNRELAERLGINRNTVNKYVKSLGKMEKDEIMSLLLLVAVLENSELIELIDLLFLPEDQQ